MARQKKQSLLDHALIEILKTLPNQTGAPSEIYLRDIKAILFGRQPLRNPDKTVRYVPLDKKSWYQAIRKHLEIHGQLTQAVIDQLNGFRRLEQSLTNHLAALAEADYVNAKGTFHNIRYSPGDMIAHYQDPDFSTAKLAHWRTLLDKTQPTDLYPKAWEDARGIYLAAHQLREKVASDDLDQMVESIDRGIRGALGIWEQIQCLNEIDSIIELDLKLNAALKKERVVITGLEYRSGRSQSDRQSHNITADGKPLPSVALIELERQTGKISNTEYKRAIDKWFHSLKVLAPGSQSDHADVRRLRMARMRDQSHNYYHMIRRKAEKADEVLNTHQWTGMWRSLLQPLPLVMIDAPTAQAHYETESNI